MGDPRKARKKFSGPGHPWQRTRMEVETALRKEYGFKNKQEIWKANSLLRAFAGQTKNLVTRAGGQADKERGQLLDRLKRMGLLGQEATLADVLTISVRNVAERRLQTLVHKKMLANSVKQARQYITHGHITVGGHAMTSPSYLVSVSEEDLIAFDDGSALSDPEHPERTAKKKEVAPEVPEESTENTVTEAESKDTKKEEKPKAKKKAAKPKKKSEDATEEKKPAKEAESKEEADAPAEKSEESKEPAKAEEPEASAKDKSTKEKPAEVKE